MNTLTRPWRELYRNRMLIRLMVRRDLIGRYKGSFAGLLWTVANPIILLTVYWFVFAVIFQVRFGVDQKPINFVFYVFAGLLPWMAFSETLIRSNTSVLSNPNLVKKVVFPLEVLPVNHAVASCLNSLIGLVMLILLVIGIRGSLSWTVFLLPVVLVPQLLMTLGFGWFLASLGVFIRDINHIIGLVLTVWMFLTPIVYPETLVPNELVALVRLNPFTTVVAGYRNVLLDGELPELFPWLYLVAVSLVIFFLGYYWFVRSKKAFADVI